MAEIFRHVGSCQSQRRVDQHTSSLLHTVGLKKCGKSNVRGRHDTYVRGHMAVTTSRVEAASSQSCIATQVVDTLYPHANTYQSGGWLACVEACRAA